MRKIYILDNHIREEEFWDRIWSNCSLEEATKEIENNFMHPIFLKYFSREGKILEAGCGLGKYIIYYRKKGYDVEGIDFSQEAINRIKKYDANLPVRVGYLTNIGCKDEYYSVYYVGGVIEHYEEGAESILKEAYRVLRKDGLLIVTVPYLNLIKLIEDIVRFKILRKKRRSARTPGYNTYFYTLTDKCNRNTNYYKGWRFHQYEYKKEEIKKMLIKSGFRPIFSKRVQVQWGIKKFARAIGIAGFKKEWKENPCFKFLKKYLLCENGYTALGSSLINILGIFFANQIAFVCEKLNK